MTSNSRNNKELEKLFDEYYTSVLMYCYTIVKNKDDAKDIVQHSFISLWEKIDMTDTSNSARSYLYTSVYNRSLDFLKHKKVVQRHESEMKYAGTKSMQPGNEEELENKIRSAINDLPPQCARVFAMSRFEGLKYKEIASSLGISEKTVENHIVKALKLLRDALKDYL